MLPADIKIKQEVAEGYDLAAKEVEDQALKEFLLRLRDHEVYHTEVFQRLAEERGAGLKRNQDMSHLSLPFESRYWPLKKLGIAKPYI